MFIALQFTVTKLAWPTQSIISSRSIHRYVEETQMRHHHIMGIKW